MMKFLFAMLFFVAGTNVGAQSDGGNLHPAASDSIDEAAEIVLPFKEVIDNSAFTAEAVDYCDEEPAGDFFYTYTPSQNESVNIRASGDDTEIYVYDLAAEGSECVSGQDDDNLGESHWYSVNYPEDLGTCDHVCSENALVDLTAGTTYHIVIASNSDGDGDGDESADARGLIFVSMAVGEDAASLLNSPAGSNVGTDDIYDAVAITLPFEEIVDNRAFSPFTDGGNVGVVPNYCEEDPAGDFFYEYTPSSDQTLNVKASGQDTEIYVYDLAESGTDRCVVGQDDDNLHESVSPHWFEATFPDDLGTCDHQCSENLNVDLTAGTTYHIVIASNSSGRSDPSDDYVEDDDNRSLIFVSMAVGDDAAANAPTEAPSVPVPLMPFWAWLALVVLAGLSGLRSMRQRRFCDFA